MVAKKFLQNGDVGNLQKDKKLYIQDKQNIFKKK